jgi:hypothetical protein
MGRLISFGNLFFVVARLHHPVQFANENMFRGVIQARSEPPFNIHQKDQIVVMTIWQAQINGPPAWRFLIFARPSSARSWRLIGHERPNSVD